MNLVFNLYYILFDFTFLSQKSTLLLSIIILKLILLGYPYKIVAISKSKHSL